MPNAKASAWASRLGIEQVVVLADVGGRIDEADEVGRDDAGALVEQLVVGVLAVGAGRAASTGPVRRWTRVPSSRMDLPLDSMSSCWR